MADKRFASWAGVLAAGAGMGAWLGVGPLAGETARDPAGAVVTYDCPGGTPDGAVHPGDRVYATARDDAGEWMAIRDPRDASRQVWVEAERIVADEVTDGLAVASCDDRGRVRHVEGDEPEDGDGPEGPAGGPDAPSATTTPDGSADPGPADPAGTPGGSSGGGGGPPPPPADTTGPTISGARVAPSSIWEQNVGGSCNGDAGLPVRATVSAAASDPAGVASVTMAWSVAGASGSAPMGGGGTYSAVLGPFPDSTVGAGPPVPITVTITATDGLGNRSTATAGASLRDCAFG